MGIALLRTRRIPLADLHPAAWNANRVPKGTLAKIRRSLETFGVVENLVVRPHPERDGYEVLSGNHRLELYRASSLREAPCVVLELDDARARLLAQTLNRTRGVEDDPDAYQAALREMLKTLTAGEISQFLPESEASIERTLARPAVGDLDRALPPPSRPRSKRGTVYELGPHRLMCGDATNADDVATLLAGAEPVLLVTDPPYGVELDLAWRWDRRADPRRGGEGSGLEHYMPTRTGSISGDTRADWSDAYELVPSLHVAYVWHVGNHASAVEAGLRRVGFEIAQQIIWDKGLFALSRGHYQWQHEAAFYAYTTPADIPWYGPRHRAAWYARRKGVKAPWLGARNQSTVWAAPSPKMAIATSRRSAEDEPVDHPTQKPAELFIRPIRNHLRPGEALYDPFVGGGHSSHRR